MGRKLGYLVLSVALLFMVSACSSPPQQELDAALAAIKDAAAAGGEKYTAEDMKKLNDQIAAAREEMKVQEAKWFKSYDKAKEMVVKAKADADALKPKIAAKKEEAKKAAADGLAAAKTAVEEAKALLVKAPGGKESRAEIEAMKADVKGLEDGFAEVETLVKGEDYLGAVAKAKAINDKAVAISDQVKQAMEKVAAAKKGKGKK